FVDFGGKSQGICSMLQFDTEPKVGEEYEFIVQKYDEREGLLLLTRKGSLATGVTWDNLEVGQVVEGTVTGVNKGGLELEVKAMRAFMPAGQVDLYHVPDLSQFIGQKMQAGAWSRNDSASSTTATASGGAPAARTMTS
ncbi:MAG: S1 RNA-binding domain-containing protein, partial [Solirubrobacteraceae bacterium]